MSLEDKIRGESIIGWGNLARVSNIVSHRRLRWLGHLARRLDEWLPKRMLFGHMYWLWHERQKPDPMGDLFQGRLTIDRFFIHMGEKSQDRLGWRAATEYLLQHT